MPPDPPRHARTRPTWSWRRRAAAGLAGAAVLAGLGIGAHILFFLHHSATVGGALVHHDERAIASENASGRCTAVTRTTSPTPVTIPGQQLAGSTGTTGPSNQAVEVVLKVPKLGLVAPVLQGVNDAQLDVGVGHVPGSSWPGLSGSDVLSAHDVTWFSEIDQLAAGDTISIVTPCHTFIYTVESHRVVKAGSPIYQTGKPVLYLVTCYPLNALYLTPNRYLVEAALTGLTTQGKVSAPAAVAAPLPTLPLPPALAAQHLDLAHNEEPLGVLSLAGTPAPAWQQSAGPLQAEALALELYFAALHTGGQDQPSWWAAIAPGLPFADLSALDHATIAGVVGSVQPTLTAADTSLTSATITSTLRLTGNQSPGTYALTLREQVQQGQLVITGLSLQPTS